jgi:hypothetical protein
MLFLDLPGGRGDMKLVHAERLIVWLWHIRVLFLDLVLKPDSCLGSKRRADFLAIPCTSRRLRDPNAVFSGKPNQSGI